MNVLIASASRHRGTAEIAERIATVLRSRGHQVDLVEAEPSRWLDDEHDAYVIGSAVYLDHWLRPARQFVSANEVVLARHPVWLFSSGPLGEPLSDTLDSDLSPSMVGTSTVVPIEHRVFPGRLHTDDLGPVERTIAHVVGAPEGDFRDWDDIAEFAHGIADTIERGSEAHADTDDSTSTAPTHLVTS